MPGPISTFSPGARAAGCDRPGPLPPIPIPGTGALRVARQGDVSAVVMRRAGSPLTLLAPRSRGPSVAVVAGSFGGGLVSGDRLELAVTLEAGARCQLGTQASTKVYRAKTGETCRQQLTAHIGPGAVLALVPDPVQPFAGADYLQDQTFELAPGASLALVDWLSAGRAARGERWAFRRFQSRNRVRCDGRLALLDSLALDAGDGSCAALAATEFDCLALLVLLGPAFEAAAAATLAELDARPVEPQSPLVVSGSPLAGGALLRLAGRGPDLVGRELRRWLMPLAGCLGEHPWIRKW